MMKPSVKPRRRQLSCSTSVAALLAGAVIIGGIVPAEAKLEVMSGNALVNQDGPRIVCRGEIEET